MSDWRIRYAAHILKQGGVIAYPTEAVYGLGCLPHHLTAVQKVLDLKQRPWEKGLILVADAFERLVPYIEPLEQAVLDKLHASWPGPNTWIVPTPATTSRLIRGQFESVAVRVTEHPVIRKLCQQCKSPLISTSANLSGQHMTYSGFQVRLQFHEQLDFIVNAPLGSSNRPSTIRDALTNKEIRA
jgi:L-threonylcarbamoyladenylate synthase